MFVMSIFTLNFFSLIFVILKNCQQVDARGGTFNNVNGDQNNIQVIVNNFPSASIEEVDEEFSVPVSVSSSLLPCGYLLNPHQRTIQTLIPNSISTRPWFNTVLMSLQRRPPLSRLISLQLRLSSRRYRKPLNLIFSLWKSQSAYSLISIFYSILHVAYHAYPSSAQAIDTAFSQNPNSSLVITHWYLHAQFASPLFHRGARRRDPLFICPYYLSLSFVWVWRECSPLPNPFISITPGSLLRSTIILVNSAFGHGFLCNCSPHYW